MFDFVMDLLQILFWMLASICRIGLRLCVSLFKYMNNPGPDTRPHQQVPVVDAVAAAAAGPQPDPSRFDPADVIYHVVAFPRQFSAKVYVYKKRGEVRRVLSSIDPTVCRQMEYAFLSTRINLPTLSLKDHSMEDILRDTEVKGAEAIRKALEELRNVRQFELPAVALVPPAREVQAAPLEQPVQQVVTPATTAPSLDAPGATVSARTARKGIPITGVVLSAGDTDAVFSGNGAKGETKGKTFEVTLNGSEGETSMRGVVLREEFFRLGVKAGDRVSIIPMGRRKVLDGDHDKGFMKNMFEVQLLEKRAA